MTRSLTRSAASAGLALLCVIVAMTGGNTLTRLQTPAAHAASVPSGLPTHFAFGLAASPDQSGIYGWMPNSGISWDYAFQYLSGGTNTGNGWETWNSSGQFALNYAQGAASHHYIPVLTYYEMAQSNGSCNSCAESQRDLSNLNNAGTMSSYFQNFALLMQRLGSGNYGGIQGFGQTAIVHVEPDLSGYTQQAVVDNQRCYGYCSGQGNNPALLRASVASSGYSPVSAYPNTYQGFNWALLHLRDLYAPNVKLAFHVSNWATSADVSSDSSTSLNATALGQQVGSFAAQSGFSGVPAGTSSYDLVFNDVSDRDASYYKYVYNDPSRWWDRLNVKFPNFHRWESYISAAGQATGRPIMVWQVPEGNQYFATVNNTNGHYQDNRAEYIFSHIAELAQAGVIGVLFGAGNGGSTVQHDGMGDGITNPASFCTSDGLSSGQICNTHTSTVSDDDGGYLRMQGQQYYASGGYSLTGGGTPPTATPGTTATSTPVPPTATKTVVVPTATKSVVVPTATKTAVVPTATKTAVAPTATATQPTGSSGTPSFTQSTTTSPASITGGTSSTLRTTVKVTSGNLVNGLVDLEVYNASWQKIGQRFFTAQNLSAGQSASYSYVWTSPNGAGTYTVMVGVFGPNWSPNYLWNSSAGTISAH